MRFTIRPFRHFTVYCPVTYQTGLFEGPRHGVGCLSHGLAICRYESVKSVMYGEPLD